MQDAGNVFSPKERAIGDRLAEEGWRVDARRPDHTVDNLKNPECMLRKDGTDEGLIAEYKTLESDSNNAVKRNINAASEQVPADGEVVIDGRAVGLTEENAARAWKRAVLQQQKTVASAVHIILGDGRMVTYVKES